VQTALCSSLFIALSVLLFKILSSRRRGKISNSNSFNIVTAYILIMMGILLTQTINGSLIIAGETVVEQPMSVRVVFNDQTQ